MNDKIRRLEDLLPLHDVTGDQETFLPIGALTLEQVMTAPPTMNEPETPPASAPDCPRCGGIGWYKEAVLFGHPNFGKLFPCECTQAKQADERATQAAAHRAEVLARLASELGDLAACRFETFDLDRAVEPTIGVNVSTQKRNLRQALKIAQDYAQQPHGWLYLYGPPGSGKSHLAAAIGHALAEQGMEVYYRSAPDMLDALQGGYRAHDYDERLEMLRVVTVLILDDLGTEAPTEHTRAKLFQIVNARLMQDRPTIITSNLPRQQLEARIASRLSIAREVPVLVSDYRPHLRR